MAPISTMCSRLYRAAAPRCRTKKRTRAPQPSLSHEEGAITPASHGSHTTIASDRALVPSQTQGAQRRSDGESVSSVRALTTMKATAMPTATVQPCNRSRRLAPFIPQASPPVPALGGLSLRGLRPARAGCGRPPADEKPVPASCVIHPLPRSTSCPPNRSPRRCAAMIWTGSASPPSCCSSFITSACSTCPGTGM
ncbi:hypothetical protein D3C80_959060 [compost metagenome]